MSTILAIDTATENCSAALFHNGQYYQESELAPQMHTKLILPMIYKVIEAANITLQDIDYVAYGHGPGSFTGIRIGASCAFGLAFGIDAKVQGVSNLKAMALKAFDIAKDKDAIYVSSIDARMSEVYLGIYKINECGALVPLIDECVLPYEKASQKINEISDGYPLVVGSGTGCKLLKSLNLSDFSEILVDFPDASTIIKIANMHVSDFVDVGDSQLAYVRNELKWNKVSLQ